MELMASFYIGISEYLSDVEDSQENLEEVNQVAEIFYANTTSSDEIYYQSADKKQLIAGIKIGNQMLETQKFTIDSPIADDEEGLPRLFYIEARFEIPSQLESELENEDIDEMDFVALLKVGNFEFTDSLVESID